LLHSQKSYPKEISWTTNLVVDESNFLGDALLHELQLKFEILAREDGVVVFLHIGS
jgi:hypothetical protein